MTHTHGADMKEYKNPVCRGCKILGTACGRCERCLENETPQPPSTFEIELEKYAVEQWADFNANLTAHSQHYITVIKKGGNFSRDYFRSKLQDQAEVIVQLEKRVANDPKSEAAYDAAMEAISGWNKQHDIDIAKISHLENNLSDTEKMLEIALDGLRKYGNSSVFIGSQGCNVSVAMNVLTQIAKMRAVERPRCKHGVCETDRCFECYPNIGLKEGEE